MKFDLSSWHFEVSSKCTLHCPRCPRQEVPNELKNTELKLEFFQKTFSPIFIHKHMERVLFCGNDGDPIYAHDLIETIEYFKKIKPRLSITIVTNGSYKTAAWWKSLGAVLNEYDKVVFSIDGYDQASNSIYRINSDWNSIIAGIKTLRSISNSFLVWATIPFAFNEEKLDEIEFIAKDLGMDLFYLTNSSKFDGPYAVNGVDVLKPSKKFTSQGRYKVSIKNLSNRVDPTTNSLQHIKVISAINGVIPSCFTGTGFGLYVTARGIFYPCCWIENRYDYKSSWNEYARSNFDLHENTLDQILSHSYWTDKFLNFEQQECRTKCSAKTK